MATKSLPVRAAEELDMTLINSLAAATKHVFEIQVGLICEIPTNKSGFQYKLDPDSLNPLIGYMSVSCESFTGTIALVFAEPVLQKIYESLVKTNIDKTNYDLADAAGELINIVYGTAKAELNRYHGYHLPMVFPSIISGRQKAEDLVQNHKLICLPVQTRLGEFQVMIL